MKDGEGLSVLHKSFNTKATAPTKVQTSFFKPKTDKTEYYIKGK